MPGEIFKLKNWKAFFDKYNYASYKANKATVAVMLHLGNEPIDGSNSIDPEGALNSLGWYRVGPNGQPINTLDMSILKEDSYLSLKDLLEAERVIEETKLLEGMVKTLPQ